MKSSGRLFILLVAGSALAASASFSQEASADSFSTTASVANGPTRSVAKPAGSGWKVYTDSVPLSAKVSVVQGKKNPDGSCTLRASGSVPPGGLAVRSDEIAFNASTCESQIYSRTWYEDPPGLDVTSVRNSTNWSYNGSCVLSNTARANYSWLSGSGWSKQADDLNGGYNCDRSVSTSYAKFRNGIFCLTIDTYNTYDRNRIFGQENGGYTWSYDVTKSGGCTALLSVHHSAAFN